MKSMKRILFLFLVVCLTLNASDTSLAAIPDLRPFRKTAYPLPDTQPQALPPNVLFLLDVGSPMTFTANGIMPLATVGDQAERVEGFRQATYGSGGRPIWRMNTAGTVSTEQTATNYYRFGRDIETKNNIIGNLNSYYSPYDLTVAKQQELGYTAPYQPYRPYFLTFKALAWANSDTLPSGYVANDLVPNDSRMYQMKLVLWRLLSEENQELLSRIKVGMATSYQEYNYGADYNADFYKVSPWGVQSGVLASFIHGTGPSWSTGVNPVNPLNDTGYQNSSYAYTGVDRDYYDPPLNLTSTQISQRWHQVNRGILKLPFDFLYAMQPNGNYAPTSHRAGFREYIDGIEETNNAGTSPTNQELFADGKTPLSMSIYGRDNIPASGDKPERVGHLVGEDTKSNNIIQYPASADLKLSYGNTYLQLNRKKLSTESDELWAGQAAGSVIDFFSPHPSKLEFNDNTAGFFPVLGSCHFNWLVVFTAANDSEGITADEAVRRLFNNTLTMRGREKVGGKWEEKNFAMDIGVRTLVVGFVNPDPSDDSTKSLRETLTLMAQAGDPILKNGVFTTNPEAKPYFANDVPSLIASLKSILARIYSDRFASSAVTITPTPTQTGAGVLYSPAYKIQVFDQWEGWFTKKSIDQTVEPSVTTDIWEFNQILKDQTARKIFTSSKAGDRTNKTAININNITLADFANLAGIPQGKVESFKTWLLKYNGRSFLGDMEHSGFQPVGIPYPYTGIPSRDVTVYLQTNRGVLHAINDATGQERWAFIPPNIFEGRLRHLKFENGTTWHEGDGIKTINSFPHSILDGNVITRDVRDAAGKYHTVLIGNLGWGGNGFYALDVTKTETTPNFLWAVENARYEGGFKQVHAWGEGAASANKNYRNLGLTIVSTSVVSVDLQLGDHRDLGLLPGGLGYKLGDGGDSQGKSLYVLDPLTGDIERELGASDFIDKSEAPNPSRSLGMLVAPLTYVKDKTGTTRFFYTADSNGNVLYCNTDQALSNWKLTSVFQLLDDSNRPVMISKSLMVGKKANGDRFIFGGTAGLSVPDFSNTRKLENPVNYIFTLALAKASGDVVTKDLTTLAYVDDGISPPNPKGVSSADFVPANQKAPDYKGWILELRGPTAETEVEYVTTAPYLYSGVVYVSTFVPKIQPTGDVDKSICPDIGTGKLYAFDPETGTSMWPSGTQAVVMKDVKIAGITAFGDKLHFSFKTFKEDALKTAKTDNAQDLASLKIDSLTNTGVMDKLNDTPPPDLPLVTPEIPYLEYWREIY